MKPSSHSSLGTKDELNQRGPTSCARQTQNHAPVPAVTLQPCVTETNKQWGLLRFWTQPIDHNAASHTSWKGETRWCVQGDLRSQCTCVCVQIQQETFSGLWHPPRFHSDICHLPAPGLLTLPATCGQSSRSLRPPRLGGWCSVGRDGEQQE